MNFKAWTPKLRTSDRGCETKVTPLKKMQKSLKVFKGQGFERKDKLPQHWRRGLSLHNIAKKQSHTAKTKFSQSKSNTTLRSCHIYHCSPIFVPKKRVVEERRRPSIRRIEESVDFLSKTSLYDVIKEAESQLTQEHNSKTNVNLMNIAFCESDEDNIYEDVEISDNQEEDIYEEMELHKTFVVNNSNYYMKMSVTDV